MHATMFVSGHCVEECVSVSVIHMNIVCVT